MKRIFDFSLALIGLILSSPLWVIFGLAIWLEDRGPVFYSQERVGKDGKIFKIWKFRSMRVGAEAKSGPVQAKENDPRATSIGKLMRTTAMDELPQLWNILKGEMSFVGPKGLRYIEIEVGDDKPRSIWEFEGAKERALVKPGLTGVAQVFAPRGIRRGEKFKYDAWYIRNRSFILDVYIVLLSFLVTSIGKWEIKEDKFHLLGRRLKKRVEAGLKDLKI